MSMNCIDVCIKWVVNKVWTENQAMLEVLDYLIEVEKQIESGKLKNISNKNISMSLILRLKTRVLKKLKHC